MAATRYVNTANSASGDGTTNETDGSGDSAFKTLLEAINSLPGTLTEPYTIYCEGTAADTSAINQTPWDMTTSAANDIHIIGEQSPNHPNFDTAKSGKFDTSLYRVAVTNVNAIYNNIPSHLWLDGLQVQLTVTDASSYVAFKTTNQNQVAADIDCRISHCIAKGILTSGDVIGFNTRFPDAAANGTSKVWNCLAIDCTTGFNNDFGQDTDVGEYYNCTSADCEFGFIEDATMKCINCLSHGATIGFVGTFVSGTDYNAEDDGNGVPGGGTHNRTSQTFTFVNAASDDFHLASGDAGAKNFGIADPGSGLFSDDIDGGTRSGSWDIGADEEGVVFDPSTEEQEGFCWGIDDGNEASHSFQASQDSNISLAANQSRLLRVLVNATLDPASTAYTLRYQKNGSGGYVALPVGSTTKTTPVIETTDSTDSGNNTATGSWAVSHPAAATGDLLIFCISWDDSTATTDVSEPAGANGETLSEVNATPATDSGTTVRCKVWYTVATASWSASTLTFTPSASEQWTASVIKVPAGEFDSSTPIGASDTEGITGTGANVQHGSFSAGPTDGFGKLCVWTATDANPQTVAAGFSQVANVDRGAVAGGFFTRDTAVTDSESFSATTVSTQTAAGWATVAFVVRAPTTNNEVYVTTSANITAGGEATTARLAAPSGKSTSDFVTGRRWDDENGSDSIDITADNYTEVEWLVFIASSAVDGDFFDFRVYGGSLALDTYTLTPRWTVGGAMLPLFQPKVRTLIRL